MLGRVWGCFTAVLSLCGVLVACSDGLTVEEVTHNLHKGNQTYLLYQQGNSLYAVDPRTPNHVVPLEADEPTLEGAVLSLNYIRSELDPRFRLRVMDNLVYAKNGNIWRVNVRLNSDLRKHQVSSETGASSICSSVTFPVYQPSSGLWQPIYKYTLPGADDVCTSSGTTTPVFGTSVELTNPSDNEVRQVSIHADARTAPTVVPSSNYWSSSASMVSLYDYSSMPWLMRGALIHDSLSGELLWFDGDNFGVPGKVVASNVTSMRWILIKGAEEVYLTVNGELYRYIVGSDSLGQSLGSVGETGLISYSSGTFYILNSSQFMRLEMEPTPTLQVIGQNTAYSGISRILRSMNDYIVAVSSQAQGYNLVSVRLSDGELTHLVEIVNDQPQSSPRNFRDKEYLYYSDYETGQSGYVSPDGAVNETFEGLTIEAPVRNTINNRDQPYITYLLLSAPSNNGQQLMYSFDTQSGELTLLGSYSGSSFRLSTPNNNNILVRIHSNGNYEIFFLQLNRENSLTQITDNTNGDSLSLVSTSYYQPFAFNSNSASTAVVKEGEFIINAGANTQ